MDDKVACAEILERDLALQMIERVLNDARNQKMASGFFTGPAGIGKSLLLNFAKDAASDFDVGWSRSDEIGSGIALGSIWRSITTLGVKDPFASVGGASLADRLATASLWLQDWALIEKERPLLLILDDLHWADAGSLALLNHFILSQLRAPIAILGSARPWPKRASNLFQELSDSGVSCHLELEPLSDRSARELIVCYGDADPDPDQVSLAQERCGGNPLLLIHFARDITRSQVDKHSNNQLAHPNKDHPAIGSLPNQLDIHRLDIHRLVGTDPQTVRFARVASAMGDEFPLSVVVKVAGSTPSGAIEIIDHLVYSGVFSSENSTNVKFSHSMLREIIYQSIPGPLRTQIHQALFKELISLGYGPEWCASHAGWGGMKGDPAALEVTVQAGDLATKLGDIDTAIKWYSQALELMGNQTPPELILHTCGALIDAGDPRLVVGQLTQLLQLQKFQGAALARAKHLRSKANYALGEIENSQLEYLEAAEIMKGFDPDESAIYLSELALNTFYTLGPRHVTKYIQGAIALTEKKGSKRLSDIIRSISDLAETNLASRLAQPSRTTTLEPYPEKVSNSQGYITPSLPAWIPALARIQVAKFKEDFTLAGEYYESANVEFDLQWRPLTRSYFDVAHADTLTRLGRLADAMNLLEELATLGKLLGSRRTWVEVGLANIYFHQGKVDLANQYLNTVKEALQSRPETWYPMLRFWQTKVEIDVALYKGELAGALKGAKAIEKLTLECGVSNPNSAPWHSSAVTAYARNGLHDQVRRVIAMLTDSESISHLTTPKAIVAHARGLLSQAAGDPAGAENNFNIAINLYRALSMPLDEANALLSYGSFVRKQFGAKLARPILVSALEKTNSIGAFTLSSQITSELRLAQGRISKKRTDSTILTPAQERVRDYVLNGLSNREIANALFISPRTVEHHISVLLKHYGVQSRKELIQVLLGH